MVQEAILRLAKLVTGTSPTQKRAWLKEFCYLGSLGMLLPSGVSNTEGEFDGCCICILEMSRYRMHQVTCKSEEIKSGISLSS